MGFEMLIGMLAQRLPRHALGRRVKERRFADAVERR